MKDIRPSGSRAIFNYSLNYDGDSEISRRLFYRTGEEVTVLSFSPEDGLDIDTLQDRILHGCVGIYRVLFPDGHEDEAFEDELYDAN